LEFSVAWVECFSVPLTESPVKKSKVGLFFKFFLTHPLVPSLSERGDNSLQDKPLPPLLEREGDKRG
jgi:hypothetical protein